MDRTGYANCLQPPHQLLTIGCGKLVQPTVLMRPYLLWLLAAGSPAPLGAFDDPSARGQAHLLSKLAVDGSKGRAMPILNSIRATASEEKPPFEEEFPLDEELPSKWPSPRLQLKHRTWRLP
jgi:hypothetical protein